MRRLKAPLTKDNIKEIRLKHTETMAEVELTQNGVYIINFDDVNVDAGEVAYYKFNVGNRVIFLTQSSSKIDTVNNHCLYPEDGQSFISYIYDKDVSIQDSSSEVLILTDDFALSTPYSIFDV